MRGDPDRFPNGQMVVSRREWVTRTHGFAYAHHVSIGFQAACSGAPLLVIGDGATTLARCTDAEMCQRSACVKRWRAER